jgi:ATP-dependent exoDNAse (exonuclease V) beta subunit
MILASAGAGKTYALTNRFVALLAEGAAPERIVALTFTRKAAGEFFDEILHKLARAATVAESAARLAADIGRPGLGTLDFQRLLRTVVDAMPRLRLGTLDGFFARIARVFPAELGLAGAFEVLPEHGARIARARVLQRMFVRTPDGLDDAQREFIEAFKRATFGAEEKRLTARLDRFLDEHHETFLDAPAAELWGNPARIWPAGCDWLEPGGRRLADAVAALRTALAARGLGEKSQARWEAFFAALPDWAPGAPLPKPVEYLLKNALDVWPGLGRGAAEIVIERRKIALTPPECADLAVIIRHVVSAELMRRLETTRGIHAVLRGYDAAYHDRVRRAGRLTFADVQRLLRPEASGLALARDAAADGEGRLRIDYRLDAQFDHWLLDEFQDTSFGQWSVLRNLIDEVVQDSSGARSFFCVGDVKQAIYSWREGDARLFREILDHYNGAAPGTIVVRHLVESRRSGPDVIAMVNAVFGRGRALAERFPASAAERWNQEWRDHVSAHPALTGQAAWLYAADEEGRRALTLQLLREIDPVGRGLTCAVLTQTNAEAAVLAEFLRRAGGIPAVAESDLRIATDNPLGAALLALLQAAAHPGDRLAWEHVQMTPLAAALERAGIRRPEQLTARLLGQLHAEGFERTLESWLARLEPVLDPADAFSRERGRQFVAAAALFDASGSRDVAEFVAFMERHAVRGTETADVVRVMTIHKAKGLGFDVVVLPDLEGQRIDQRRSGLAVQRSPARAVEWVLELPTKLFCENDATLDAHVRQAEAEACYEAFALLYVAMTRARRAMYLITKPAGGSESRNYPRLLTDTLGAGPGEVAVGGATLTGAWTAGDARWFATVTRAAPATEERGGEDPVLDPAHSGRAVRRLARRPSAERSGSVPVAQIFALTNGGATAFGEAVHALFAEVEWGDAVPEEAWRARGVPADVVAEVTACLRAPALAGLWRRPVDAILWRERAFEIVLDGAWIAGVFDRVVIDRDPRGGVRSVTVFDFKTDRVAGAADVEEAVHRHLPQLTLYRRVAAVLAGVPVTEVTAELVFTALRRRVPVGV